jgi:LysR family transcriptional regulator for metE and metH
MNSFHVEPELEVRHLKLVEAIAEEGTMTKASGRLNLTQSALSHQLVDLEAALGLDLFTRTPRGMELTAAGEIVLTRGRAALREIREALDSLTGSERCDRGLLRISTECYTCYHWLPPRLKQFQLRHPRVEVSIVAEATRQPVEALLRGELDIAIVSGTPRQSGLDTRPLFRDELVAIMSPDHPLAAKAFLRPEDFLTENLLTYSLPPERLTVFQEFLAPAGVTPARHSRVELSEAIIEMVKAGLGIGVLARWAVAPYLANGSLKAVRLTRKGIHREWTAVRRKMRHPPPYLDEFMNVLATWNP